MSEEVDLVQLAKLIDAALGSDNPSVQKALRNFLLVASIVESENEDSPSGPFRDYFSKVDELARKVRHLEEEAEYRRMTTEKSKGYSWDQYTTTWPSTYTTGTTGYKSKFLADSDADYLSKLLNNKGIL